MGGRFCAPDCTCGRHFPRPERGRRISEKRRGQALTHGRTSHPLYSTWIHMMTRCYNENSTGYKYWGGRGIRVCDEWQNARDFVWWMESCEGIGWRPENMSFDRVDNDGNYEPGNVRWATRSEQNLNRRG